VFSLRYYQDEAVNAVRAEWEKVQSTAVIAATGTGKTELYLSLAVSEPGRVLVLAHRDYLLDQPRRRLAEHGFDDVALEKAEHRSESYLVKPKVVLASVQSLSRPNRLAAFDPFSFSALVVDEGHRAVARTYRRVLDHFRKNHRLRILVLTASPKRKDGVALGNVCDSVAYTYGPRQAIAEGWIVPLRFYRREVKGLDFSRVTMRGSDLDQEQVEREMLELEPLHKVCASLAEDTGPTAVFCPGVALARAYLSMMQRYRPNRSAMLWQGSGDEERELTGKRLAQGELDYVFNVDIITEGYDVPELMRVVWAAPTASLVRFTQGTGRVFRPHGGLRGVLAGDRDDSDRRRLFIEQSPKPFGQVVTYYPQNCRHQLCEPNDILGGDDLPPELKATAKMVQEQTAAQKGGSDPDEDMKTAASVLTLKQLLELRWRRIVATAATEDTEYDGFGGARHRAGGDSAGASQASAAAAGGDWPPGDDASPKQLGWLKWKGVRQPEQYGLTKFRASVVRDLMEAGVSAATALGYGKRQALAVRESYRKKADKEAG
jgi:superfamily II DNA or RNA helicase